VSPAAGSTAPAAQGAAAAFGVVRGSEELPGCVREATAGARATQVTASTATPAPINTTIAIAQAAMVFITGSVARSAHTGGWSGATRDRRWRWRCRNSQMPAAR
jgi:hypothetical protein